MNDLKKITEKLISESIKAAVQPLLERQHFLQNQTDQRLTYLREMIQEIVDKIKSQYLPSMNPELIIPEHSNHSTDLPQHVTEASSDLSAAKRTLGFYPISESVMCYNSSPSSIQSSESTLEALNDYFRKFLKLHEDDLERLNIVNTWYDKTH